MADKSKISWTQATWNPIRGCSRVSAGCQRCYAEQQAARIVRMGKGAPTAYDGLVKLTAAGEPRWTGEVRLVPEALSLPLRWSKPRRIFVNSMSDLFHESLTNEQIAAVFGVMAASPRHTFQVLTKRARRMREWFEWARAQAWEDGEDRPDFGLMLAGYAGSELGDGSSTDEGDQQAAMEDRINDAWARDGADGGTVWDCPWPLPNLWLGVSVENQAAADERIPELLRTPAAVRFLSCEPLLGSLDLNRWVFDREKAVRHMMCGGASLNRDQADDYIAPMNISWLIAGCESGPGARPCSVEWLRSLRDQCAAAGVPFFLKQAVGTVHDSHESRGLGAIEADAGSRRKPGGVIELPYLDGVQHAAFPEVDHG